MNTPTRTPASAPPGDSAQRLDAAQLAEAFALFSRASEELSSAYNALQGQVSQLTERLSVLMGALPAGVVVLDHRRCIVQINRAAESLLGRGLGGRDWAAVAERLAATETPGEYLLGPGSGDGGVRRVSLSESALESRDELIILLHDVTDTHRMRQQAERSERLAAMGEMVAGLAHQLRTPLSAALLYAANLRQAELAPADRDRVADRAIERLRHLERLIRDMLLFARGDSRGRQQFSVCELLVEIGHTLEPLVRARQVDFSMRCDCGELTLLADRKALGGALTNLIDNAIQATDRNGTVSVHAFDDGQTVFFRVADNGRGIELAQQHRLFEPFFTTRAEGTGLGLAIARGVARGHGGDIGVESLPGCGSVFTLSLPCSTEHGADARGAAKESI